VTLSYLAKDNVISSDRMMGGVA